MRKEFLEAGKIVGTHGIRGMVRIKPWSDNGEFLEGFKTLYLNEGESQLKIQKIQPHGNVVIAAIEGVDSIEAAEKLRDKVIYIKRADAKIPEGRYFISELIGSRVFDFESGRQLGILSDVSATGANDVWHIENEGKEYLVPAVDEVINEVDIDSETIKITALKGIFDDEN